MNLLYTTTTTTTTLFGLDVKDSTGNVQWTLVRSDWFLLVAVLDVVPAASPDPGRLEVLRPVGSAAAAAGELSVPAASRHAVHHPRTRHRVGEGRLLRGWNWGRH